MRKERLSLIREYFRRTTLVLTDRTRKNFSGTKKKFIVSSIAKLKSDYKNPKSFLDGMLVRVERLGSGVGRKKDRDFPDRVSREKKNGKRWEQKCCVSAGKKSADPDLGV